MTSVNERNLSPEEAEDEVMSKSPAKKELERDLFETEMQIARSNSR